MPLEPQRRHFISETEPCYTCRRAQQTIHRFLEDGDYWELAESFDSLRIEDPDGTQHLTRWQADAALLAEQWDAAWELRRIGLLGSSRRITLEDIVNVRARCNQTLLVPEDLNLFVLSNNGLTRWGSDNFPQINSAVATYLDDFYREHQTNPLQEFYNRYAGREPTEDDFTEITEDCEYSVSPELLRRHMEGEKFTVNHFRQQSTSLVEHQMHEWYAAPKLWCFQPTQGRFIEGPPAKLMADGKVLPLDLPRFPYTRVPSWIRVAAEALCRTRLRRLENDARREAGLPEIGEGWVSETELYRRITEAFSGTRVLQHARPQWLGFQHLDIFLPEHNVGIEYHGEQHFQPIDFFGGEEGLRKRREQDARKRRLCGVHGCTLIEVTSGYDLRDVIKQVRVAIETNLSSS